jgi:hypothetical protein
VREIRLSHVLTCFRPLSCHAPHLAQDDRATFTMTFARNIIIFTVTVSLVTFIAFFGRLPAFRYVHSIATRTSS